MAPNPLLTAADTVRRATTNGMPTDEVGSVLPRRQFDEQSIIPGWSVFEAQAATIPVDALRWPRSVRTYEDMRRDGQIQGLLQSVWLPIRHMEWYVDPAGTTGTVAEEIAEDLGLPLAGEDPPGDAGPGIDFDEHLRLALIALALGHQFFEESGDIDGEGASMRYRLKRLAQRPQTTISRINVAPNGDLLSIQQTGALPAPLIPADRLVPYVWDREGGNWAGRPLLYGIYRHWLLKDELIRGDAVTKRRFSGIPVSEQVQPGVTETAHEEAAAMMQRLRSGDTAGISMPFGLKARLLGVEGTLPDAIASVKYHDQQMARAFLQMFAELGQTPNGSRALGQTLADHYALGVFAIAKWFRKSLMQLVQRIAVRNYGPGVVLPAVKFRHDDDQDMPVADLVSLIDAGVVVVDEELEATIRERGNLPAKGEPRRGQTAPQPVAARSAGRRQRPALAAAAAAADPATVAQTDFAGLQQTFEDTLAQLTEAWQDVQAAQIDELVGQVAAATTVAELAAITPAVAGTAVLAEALNAVLEHGAQTAVDEAAAQGAALPAPDLADAQATIADAAEATAAVLARQLGESAASRAIGLAGGGASFEDVAGQVREHLEGLKGAVPEYEIGGLISHAQNEGRFTAMEGAADGTRFYASELNDSNTCTFCAVEDDTEFDSLAEARLDYPAGGYVACEGGKKCRGTVVAVYAETEGQA